MATTSPPPPVTGGEVERLTLYLRAHIPPTATEKLPDDVVPWLASVDPDSLLAASLLAAAFPVFAESNVKWSIASSASLPRPDRSAAPLLLSDRRTQAVVGIGAIYDLLTPLLHHFSDSSTSSAQQQGTDLALRAYLQRHLTPLSYHALYAIPETLNERVLPAYKLAYQRTARPPVPSGLRHTLAMWARHSSAVNEVIRLRTQLTPALQRAGLSTPDDEARAARDAAHATTTISSNLRQLPSAGQDVFASSTSARTESARLGIPPHAPGMGPSDASTTSHRFRQAKVQECAWGIVQTLAGFYQDTTTGYLHSSSKVGSTDVLVYALLAPLLSYNLIRDDVPAPPTEEEDEPITYMDNLLRRLDAAPVLRVVRQVHSDLWSGGYDESSCVPGSVVGDQSHDLVPVAGELPQVNAKIVSPDAGPSQLVHLLYRGTVHQLRSTLWFVPGFGLGKSAVRHSSTASGPVAISEEERSIAQRRKYWMAGTVVGLIWWVFAAGIVQIQIGDDADEEEWEEQDLRHEQEDRMEPVDDQFEVDQRPVDDDGYVQQDDDGEAEWQEVEEGFDPDEVDPDDVDAHFEYEDEDYDE